MHDAEKERIIGAVEINRKAGENDITMPIVLSLPVAGQCVCK